MISSAHLASGERAIWRFAGEQGGVCKTEGETLQLLGAALDAYDDDMMSLGEARFTKRVSREGAVIAEHDFGQTEIDLGCIGLDEAARAFPIEQVQPQRCRNLT